MRKILLTLENTVHIVFSRKKSVLGSFIFNVLENAIDLLKIFYRIVYLSGS